MVKFNPFISSSTLTYLEYSKIGYITTPYRQGFQNLGKALRFTPGDIFRKGPEAGYVPRGLINRVVHAFTGILLLIPVINTIMIIALRKIYTHYNLITNYNEDSVIREAFVGYFRDHPHRAENDAGLRQFNDARVALRDGLTVFARCSSLGSQTIKNFLAQTQAPPQLVASLLPYFAGSDVMRGVDFIPLLNVNDLGSDEEKIRAVSDFFVMHPGLEEFYLDTINNVETLANSVHTFYDVAGTAYPLISVIDKARICIPNLASGNAATREELEQRFKVLEFIISHKEQIFRPQLAPADAEVAG